jgi:preprotein translocase subunit SecE
MNMSATKEISADSDVREPGGPPPPVVTTRGLGLARWVQYVFVLIAALVFWITDKLVLLAWQNFAEPNEVVATIASAAVGVGVGLTLYRHEKSHRMVTEVVSELAKVSWPSRKETYASTIIVIVTSLIAAAIVGSFDFVWSAITDLLYKYKV